MTELSRDTLASIIRLRDSAGVLSVYLNVDPSRQASQRPPWEIDLRNCLKAVKETAKSSAPREHWNALQRRLDGLQDDLASLGDPRLSGRGRALFAPVSDGTVCTVALQMPLPTTVVLEPTAYIRPLLRVLDEGRPAGIVTLWRTGVRVLEWKLGIADDVARWDLDVDTSEWRLMKAPRSGPDQAPVNRRDRFERRMDQQREHFFDEVAPQVDALAGKRGWDRLVISGDPRLTESFAGALPAANGGRRVLFSDRVLEAVDATQVSNLMTPLLQDANRQREAELVERAVSAAAAGGQGSLGLRDTLTALHEGRVLYLLLDGSRDFRGMAAPDGRLAAENDVPEGADPSELVPEPLLAERMIEMALQTDALVIPIESEAAARLAPGEGVAAILRW